MVEINFKVEKALQAFAYLLGKHGGVARYYHLLKMLYMADRESIQERGTPISTDTFVAFENGPSLSTTYNCIKGETEHTWAFAQVVKKQGVHVRLIQDVGRRKLSRFEVEKLDEVYERYKNFTWQQWKDHTHHLAEWRKNSPSEGSSRRIPLEDVIDAVGMGAKKDEILKDLKASEVADSVFGE